MMKLYLVYSRRDTSEIAEVVTSGLKAAGHIILQEKHISPREIEWASMVDELVREADWLVILVSEAAFAGHSRVHVISAYAQMLNKPIAAVVVQENAEIPINLLTFPLVNIANNLTDGIPKIDELIRTYSKHFDTPNTPPPAFNESTKEILRKDVSDARVFIAYSRKQKHLAKALADLLTQHATLNFWDAKIHAGAAWRQTIQKALNGCTHLIVIWTPDAAQSDEVEREVSYALARGKVIIPILSKDIPELPYHLYGFQYVIFDGDWSAIEDDLMRSIESISGDDIWQ